MAIAIEFVSLVIPIPCIKEKYPGGWDEFIADNTQRIGKIVWYDNHLCHADGTMDSGDIDYLIEKWTDLGFDATEDIDGKTVWKDFCVFSSFGGSDHICTWLCLDPCRRIAWLAGTEPGLVVSRKDHEKDSIKI